MIQKIILSLSLLILFTSNIHSQWNRIGLEGEDVNTIIYIKDKLIAGAFSNIYESYDNGQNWDTLFHFNNCCITYIEQYDNNLFAGFSNLCTILCPIHTTLYRSTNDGSEWDSVYASRYGSNQFTNFNNLLLANSDDRLIVSNDNGISWNPGHDFNSVYPIASSKSYVYIGTSNPDSNLFKSSDGSNWIYTGQNLPRDYIFDIISLGDSIFAMVSDSIFFSMDHGMNWEVINDGLPSRPFSGGQFQIINNHIFLSYYQVPNNYNKVFISDVNHLHWNDISIGLDTSRYFYIDGITGNADYIFLATSNGIWRRPFSEIVSAIVHKYLVPKSITLKQNYPNPFNTSTRIDFEIWDYMFVELKLYDILGREVKILYSTYSQPGKKSIFFNASDLTSGIYYYILEGGQHKIIKKMIFLK